MAARTIEARLVISGEDRASTAIANVVKTVRQLEEAAKVSRPLQEVTKTLQQVEQASRAVDSAMKARTGFSQAEAGLKATREAAAGAARALEEARRARAAFDGVKAAKGSEQAQQIEAATRAVREAGSAYRKTEGEVRRATAAVAAQSASLQHAERAVAAVGGDLKNLEGQQRNLRQVYDATTAAIVRQVRAEEQATRVGAVMGGAGRIQLERIEMSRRLTDGMSAQARATRALADEEARLVRVEHERKRASAGRDLTAGMGSAGRVEAARIDGGRRLTEGLSAPAREARAAVEAANTAAAARSLRQREARDVAAGVAGAAASSALNGAYVKARDGWLEMDEASRRQKAVLGLTDEKQAPLNAQALKIGQDTRFSNPDVVKAQTRIGSSLPDHLKDPKVITSITENAKNYALAMGTTMDEASSAVLGRMLGLRMDMSTPEATAASAKHATNRLVQFAKSSGADHNDLMGYTKFGAAPSSIGGFSEEFTDAMAAQLRRIGYEGSMAGNFVRAAATKLAVPTSKGLGVLAAAGIEHSDYVAPGKELSADNLDASLKLKFGKGLNDSQRKRIRELMDDEDVVGSREEFVPKASAIIQETLAKRTKRGTVNANDAERIAKSVNEYLTAASGAVDIERLMRDVIAKGIRPAMAKYLFGQEHGGRAQALDLKTLDKDVDTFRKTPDNRAQKIGEDINAGSYGAYQRMIGSVETFWMRLGQVNDGPLTTFYDKMGNAVDAVSGLPNGALQAGTALAGFAGVAVAARGALGIFRIGKDLLGFGGGAALTGSAAALTQSAILLDAAALKLAGGSASDLIPGKKGGGKGAGLLGALGLGGIGFSLAGAGSVAYVLSEYGDASKSVNGTGGRPDPGLTLNPGDELPGLSGSTDKPSWVVPNAPSMTLAPGAMPLTIQGTGVGGFGLSGPVAPAQAGKEAGEKLGKGVADGIEAKGPEVERQGRTLYERIKELFAQGINMPINFAPGSGMGGEGGGGLIHRASFGAGSGGSGPGLGGLVRRSSLGSSSGSSDDGSQGTGFIPRSGSGGISARDMRGIHPEFAAHIRASALSQGIDPNIAMRIANSEGLRGSTPNRLTPGDYENGKPTSFGPFQLHYGRSGGLGNRYTKETGHHAGDPQHWREQIDFALRTARKEGWGAWYGRKGAGIGLRDGIGTVRPVPMPNGGPLVPADEPRLVKGLDGKEGLDLGDGTMKMPDGSIRSITRGSGLTIPEPPAGGFGGSGGRGDMRAAAERMHQAADRMEGMGFHGQIQLAVTGPGRDSVRATGMRTRGRGGMSADMGVSMPGAKESDGDWV